MCRCEQKLEDFGRFLVNGEIEDEMCEDVLRWIYEENFRKDHKNLTLIINSQGGLVSAGFAIIDAITASEIPITTVGIGEISSMGLSIFITGKERILSPNTLIMSHQWAGWIEGKEHELKAGIKRDCLIGEMILRHYKKHTGLSIKKIKKHLLPPSDVYLSAKEALELNLCDRISLFK